MIHLIRGGLVRHMGRLEGLDAASGLLEVTDRHSTLWRLSRYLWNLG